MFSGGATQNPAPKSYWVAKPSQGLSSKKKNQRPRPHLGLFVRCAVGVVMNGMAGISLGVEVRNQRQKDQKS